MQTPTKTIETPIGKHKVEIREWITARQREFINEPLYTSVNVKPEVVGGKPDMKMGSVDVNKFITESAHRELETFVVSVEGLKELEVEGKKVPAWEYVLDYMHEDDGEFIKAEIEKTSKKKETAST